MYFIKCLILFLSIQKNRISLFNVKPKILGDIDLVYDSYNMSGCDIRYEKYNEGNITKITSNFFTQQLIRTLSNNNYNTEYKLKLININKIKPVNITKNILENTDFSCTDFL